MNKKLGVSLYLSNIDKIEYLKNARKDGVKNLFLSIHTIEDVKNKNYKDNVLKLFEIVRTLSFDNVICDISPIAMEALGIYIEDIKELDMFPVNTWRLDFGFTDADICEFSQQFKIAINASQVTKNQLDYFDQHINKRNVVAFHNFYPLPGTGLSLEDLILKDILLRERGYHEIYSFIRGNDSFRPTGNLAEGLVTLEKNRSESSIEVFMMLTENFKHQIVFIGDPDYFDISTNVSMKVEIVSIEDNHIELNKVYSTRNSDNFIRLKGTRSNVRSESGGPTNKFKSIEPITLNNITKGDILICNSNAQRYLGEIVIAKKPLPKQYSQYFNLIGKVSLSNLQILEIERHNLIEFN